MIKFKFLFLLVVILFVNSAFAQTKPSLVVLYTKSGDSSEEFENLTDTVRFAIDQYNILYKKKLELQAERWNWFFRIWK